MNETLQPMTPLKLAQLMGEAPVYDSRLVKLLIEAMKSKKLTLDATADELVAAKYITIIEEEGKEPMFGITDGAKIMLKDAEEWQQFIVSRLSEKEKRIEAERFAEWVRAASMRADQLMQAGMIRVAEGGCYKQTAKGRRLLGQYLIRMLTAKMESNDKEFNLCGLDFDGLRVGYEIDALTRGVTNREWLRMRKKIIAAFTDEERRLLRMSVPSKPLSKTATSLRDIIAETAQGSQGGQP